MDFCRTDEMAFRGGGFLGYGSQLLNRSDGKEGLDTLLFLYPMSVVDNHALLY